MATTFPDIGRWISVRIHTENFKCKVLSYEEVETRSFDIWSGHHEGTERQAVVDGTTSGLLLRGSSLVQRRRDITKSLATAATPASPPRLTYSSARDVNKFVTVTEAVRQVTGPHTKTSAGK